MKHLRFAALLGAVIFLGTTAISFAQTDVPPAPAKASVASPRARVIKIKNVSSSFIAYQIDPANNPAPIGSQAPATNVPATEPKGAFTLPDGITQIVSIDPQNALLVGYTDEEAMRQIAELIDVLDQPKREVALEIKVIRTNFSDARAFGLDFSEKPDDEKKLETAGKFNPKIAKVRNNFTARLNALIADNKAKIIAEPTVTVSNGMWVELPLIKRPSARVIPLDSDKANSASLADNSEIVLKALLVTKGDDSISLHIKLVKNSPLSNDEAPRQIVGEALIDARGGETIAIGNLASLFSDTDATRRNFKVPLSGDIPIIGGLFRSKTVEEPEEILIFITPRIVRRSPDETPKA